MSTKIQNSSALSKAKVSQIADALSAEAGCNLADASISCGWIFTFVQFTVAGVRKCALINPSGSYFDFRESIASAMAEGNGSD
ncbi:MAG: hypothetical protein ACRCVV_21890 [Shewanella sp.]